MDGRPIDIGYMRLDTYTIHMAGCIIVGTNREEFRCLIRSI